ncbi:hypothetical protein ASG81_11585 [Paenibacillus sp. Soil522]|nr:hypothetical protein ASG81_11585 [Paenibacillus sp. Soil522]
MSPKGLMNLSAEYDNRSQNECQTKLVIKWNLNRKKILVERSFQFFLGLNTNISKYLLEHHGKEHFNDGSAMNHAWG